MYPRANKNVNKSTININCIIHKVDRDRFREFFIAENMKSRDVLQSSSLRKVLCRRLKWIIDSCKEIVFEVKLGQNQADVTARLVVVIKNPNWTKDWAFFHQTITVRRRLYEVIHIKYLIFSKIACNTADKFNHFSLPKAYQQWFLFKIIIHISSPITKNSCIAAPESVVSCLWSLTIGPRET